jgi:hypothetical protein
MQTYSTAEPRRTPSPDIVRRPTMSPATNQQYDIYTPSRRSPLSEIVRGSSRRSPPPDIAQRFPTAPPARGSFPPQRDPEFLIVGLFALRLTKHLIGGLEHYFGRDADMAWLANFLAPFPHDFALAKISGHRKQDYETSYQNIVARMKRQSRYPMRFMQLNPDKSMKRQHEGREAERERPGEISDSEHAGGMSGMLYLTSI